MNLSERTYLWYLAVLRVYVGYFMLLEGVRKFQHDFPKGDWIGRQIGDIATLDIYPWYKKLLLDYVAPHHELFGYLVMIGEIAVGACLLVGLLSRFSALAGLFMLINYYLGLGMVRGGTLRALQEIFIIALAIFVLAQPGRTLGLDGLLFRGGGGKGKGAR
jgi:thiosulfate dehydrogenase [quinone] large subunit